MGQSATVIHSTENSGSATDAKALFQYTTQGATLQKYIIQLCENTLK